jgi:hypothetical protein
MGAGESLRAADIGTPVSNMGDMAYYASGQETGDLCQPSSGDAAHLALASRP